MTAEEYLNEHCKPEDWNNLEESLKDSIWTNNVIEYMTQYAALRIHDVIKSVCDCNKWHDRMEESNNNCSTCDKPIK